jgi:hypothetical protein
MGSSGALSGSMMKGSRREVGAAHLRQRIARTIIQDDSNFKEQILFQKKR